jgi:hypothetical protein
MQEVGYGPYGRKHLHIKVEPKEKKDFYFTDEKPGFLLHVKNIGSELFDDDLRWFISFPGGRETPGFCSINLKPGEKDIYPIGDRLLGFPGTAALCLTLPPKLPMRDIGINNNVFPQFHTLYTFEVFDRALFKREQRERLLLRVSVTIAALTFLAVIVGLVI